jgi:Ran GTPase-activating protein (RanGAP) involved in mRNA processing and transport
VNTGLLDEGVRILLEGLAENKSIQHLYLGSNGITPTGAVHIANYIKNTPNRLISLFLSLNRLNDSGVAIIAEALKTDKVRRRSCFFWSDSELMRLIYISFHRLYNDSMLLLIDFLQLELELL